MTSSNSKGEKLSEILAELKAEYQKSFPLKIQQLKTPFQAQDWPALAEEFHKLKGTGKTYGFPEVSLICEALELYCRRGPPVAAAIEPVFSLFERMQTSWREGHNFDLQKDPEAIKILQLKGV